MGVKAVLGSLPKLSSERKLRKTIATEDYSYGRL